jgi:hypothetical protein
LERLSTADLAEFASFQLLVLEPGRRAAVFQWTEPSKGIAVDPPGLLASSSIDAVGVRLARSAQFRALPHPLTPETLRDFHRSHGSEPSAYSPCMHRRDAQTVSFTSIHVANGIVRMQYRPGLPCESNPSEELCIRY